MFKPPTHLSKRNLPTSVRSSFLPASHLPDMVRGLAASSAMLSPVVQTVLQMGFEAGLVESLVQTKYLLTGRQYTSVSDLVSDVLQAEQEDRERAPQSRGNSGVVISSPNCCAF